ncbi:hypothetical protein AAFF_G00063340 [Aldrovandia affinis]|uniref:Uncharacterized protein n=1 Tax=Aldrovandia affinis TaxID=143900 RepID=A0AAD7RZW7_9TELE|nr:hypothetical protein AAFF_G00063340 [Aldrovandia affinis]
MATLRMCRWYIWQLPEALWSGLSGPDLELPHGGCRAHQTQTRRGAAGVMVEKGRGGTPQKPGFGTPSSLFPAEQEWAGPSGRVEPRVTQNYLQQAPKMRARESH